MSRVSARHIEKGSPEISAREPCISCLGSKEWSPIEAGSSTADSARAIESERSRQESMAKGLRQESGTIDIRRQSLWEASIAPDAVPIVFPERRIR